MAQHDKFERFFLTIARYMKNNDVDIRFCKDGSIELIDLNSSCIKKYSNTDVLMNICEVSEFGGKL